MKKLNICCQTKMSFSFSFFLVVFSMVMSPIFAQEHSTYKLENPVTVGYLKKNLNKKSPRLIMTSADEGLIRSKLQTDPLIQRYFAYLKDESGLILAKPFLKRELEGFRLLTVSRELVERMTILCMVYRLDKNPALLKRIDEEIRTVCNFSDWNPRHYLDIAEMSFGVALAIDWVGNALPRETVSIAKKSLIEKGIMPSFSEPGERMGWISGVNNWNAVCHSGMIAAALMMADVDIELAARTISRALEKLPGSLGEYAPDGVYPEGPTYWEYGTYYTVVAADMLTTALGSDFGISAAPGFMKSADFRLMATAPSGNFFNFADSGDRQSGSGSVLLTWFAAKTGNGRYFDRKFFENPEKAGRFGGLGLVWLAKSQITHTVGLPSEWVGHGANPVVVFRDDASGFYLAAKGGKADISHGNMDAGSFVLELDGVRWSIDPGNQAYFPLNNIGFNLSGRCQECPRWSLLTKHNFGHSTISVNNERFKADGFAPVVSFSVGARPEVSILMTDLYFDNLASATRRFVKESNRSVLIEDKIETNNSTDLITWSMMTLADVQLSEQGALLKQDGKELALNVISPEGITASVISLDPPPMQIDKTISGLKRIEIRVPAWTAKDGRVNIKVSLVAK